MSANDKAAAAWDDYVSQQQEEKIEELERELNAANESFRKLNIHALDLAARIKRLEEAGDAIVDHNIGCGCGQDGPCRACRMACEAWYKAKEAKP